MLITLGSLGLHLAFVAAAVALVAGVLGGRTGRQRYTTVAVYGTYTTFGLLALGATVYLHAFVEHNFELQNVVRYSDTRMPLQYLVSAFWGGQAGSLLYWTGILSCLTALATFVHRKREVLLIPWFVSVSMALIMWFLFILLFKSDPFETWTVLDAPREGNGLNPLLQTPLMVMHPPSQLGGFASLGVPYAFTMAGLLAGDLGTNWIKVARKWALLSFLLLSIGNMLGGMWAYEELGWGGYWAWDPVENAAFMPWLGTVAWLHSVMVQERRGMLKRWNVVLMHLAFLLTLFGTFITRSGLIDSVHTFAQSSIGDYFFALVIFWSAFSAGLLIWRWKKLASEANFDSMLSREMVFLGNNWILVGMTFVIFWGTLFPKIKEVFTGDKVSVGPPWFNKYMIPLAIVLVLLMGVGTLITWKKSSWKNFQRNFLIPIVGTLVLTPALGATYWYLRAQHLNVELVPLEFGYALGAFSMCVFVAMGVGLEYWRGMAARVRSAQENLWEAFLGLFERQRRRYGGYIVHLGFIMIIMAFCGNAFKVEQDVSVDQGGSVPLGDYEVRYDGLREFTDPNKALIIADLTITSQQPGAQSCEIASPSTLDAVRAADARCGEELACVNGSCRAVVATVDPARAIFHSSPENPTSEIAISTGPLEDLYFALAGFSQSGQQASFKMLISPLTWWFWFGGTVLIFGTILCMWPQDVRIAERSLRGDPKATREAARNMALILLLSAGGAAPLVFWGAASHAQVMPAEAAQHEGHDHQPAEKGQGHVRVHDPRLKELMRTIRVDCPSSGRPTMANSAPTCTDYQQDLKLLERLLAEGKSDQEILNHFVSLRGEWVLADPGNEDGNFMSWLLPLALLGLAVPVILWKVRQWIQRTEGRQAPEPALATAAEGREQDDYRKQLEQELADL
jgi:cytochrome c-type biogenesis protein CcmF